MKMIKKTSLRKPDQVTQMCNDFVLRYAKCFEKEYMY